MKRRVLSFIITLALCLNLCPVRALAAGEGTDGSLCPHHPAHTDECGYDPESPDALCTFACQDCQQDQLDGIGPAVLSEDFDDLDDSESNVPSDRFFVLTEDLIYPDPLEVSSLVEFKSNGHTFTGTGSAAIRVNEKGELHLTGKVISQNGIGVEVLSGGSLNVTEPDTYIKGDTFALDIASGAEVHLSTGTYVGRDYAIRTAGSDFADLLEPGCAYFDGSNTLMLPADAAEARRIAVGPCPDPSDKIIYTHTPGATVHTWACPYCCGEEEEACTFTFDQDGNGTCGFCKNKITIDVDESDLSHLVYDGAVKPENVSITVTLADSSSEELVKDTDYTVDYVPRTDVGEVTVTVTGITFNGTFTKIYHVEQAQPGISWSSSTKAVDYDGSPVETGDLPPVNISITASEDLHPYLQYFYREAGNANAEFTTTPPTDAGTYEVKAYLPASQNYKEAETNPNLTLTIRKISAFATAPTAKTLTYNREAQELVTAGVLKSGAVAEDAVIEYARTQNGTYSTDIPTGIMVQSYDVWYRVADTKNYSNPPAKLSARINHKEITPTVELEYYSITYTGQPMEPVVTVKDGEVVIPKSEYLVVYKDNQNVGTASVTVTNANNGNYAIKSPGVKVEFKITLQPQAALSITGQPHTVSYGDQFILGTSGGSGDGKVTWEITAGNSVATVDPNSGQVTVTAPGSFTVKATKSGTDTSGPNYNTVTASWTFNAGLRPATATVIAADKTYDGTPDATLTATVNGLVSGDSISSGDIIVSGHFQDENAGTNKTVIITGLTVPAAISAKYDISYPRTTTASITPAAASVAEVPEKIDNLKYTGIAKALVTPGRATDGTMAYSLDGINYSFLVPEGTDAKPYTVWYKAVATDGNHKDSAPGTVTGAVIGPNTDTPSVMCSPSEFLHDGIEKTPTIIVLDSSGREIPREELTIELPSPRTAPGTYTVTVKDKADGNYQFNGTVTGTFKILEAGQDPLSIITDISTNILFGDTFKLNAIGGSGTGPIIWKSTKPTVATISANGVVNVVGTGAFNIEAYREGADGHKDSNTDVVPFYADPKPITAAATAASRGYDGGKTTTVTVTVPEINQTITVTGTFDDENVGAGKTVTIVYGGNQITNSNYQITWPETATASIYKVNVELQPPPGAADLTYKEGVAQPLVTAGTVVGNIATIVYSTSEEGEYSEDIPTGTDAGPYTVWYKVEDTANYTGIPATLVEAEIKKADPEITRYPTASEIASDQPLSASILGDDAITSVPGSFAWAQEVEAPENGTEYDVIFTPNNTANYNPVTIQVKVTVTAEPPETGDDETGGGTPSGDSDISGTTNTPNASASRPSASSTATNSSGTSTSRSETAANTLSASTQTVTTVQNGKASTVVSASDGGKLVQEAVAKQSRNVVIKPEITGNVTKAEVSIPSSTVSQLSSKTDAALTVSSPIADVTIPNAALSTLSRAGSTVSVATEQVEQSVVLTLAADGKTVEQVPGGLTLTVPVEDAGPGTVAVLVHDDGTRETVRKSVVEDGAMSIPLSGSATVEIVDNSKDFADVPPESWAADAVDFAVSHELFNGTSETTFSPDQAMSRGMLATVLYRLEGSPEQDLTDLFDDVSSGSRYAEGIAWAAENGITGGYGDGRFGPDDNITREQFVVMLWRYAGSPEASGQALDFVDADQVSGFAVEALCWAVENGILHGAGNGTLNPGGTATRAHAAQLLKNFMENT